MNDLSEFKEMFYELNYNLTQIEGTLCDIAGSLNRIADTLESSDISDYIRDEDMDEESIARDDLLLKELEDA